MSVLDPTAVQLRSEDLGCAPDPIGLGHVCEPRLALLGDGTVMLAYRSGSARMSADGRVGLLRSPDGGTSWQPVASPFPVRWEGRDGDQLLAALAPVGATGVVAWLGWMDRSDDRPWRNPATDGRLPLRILQAASPDGGQTWGPVDEISVAPVAQAVPQCLITLADGTIVATFETFKHHDDPAPWHYQAGLVRSSDGGRTWSPPILAAEVNVTGRMWWDPRCVQLPDGRLVQCYHAFDYPVGRDADVHIAVSDDGGLTWTQPASTGVVGQVTCPAVAGCGELVLVQQRRHPPAGIVALPTRGSALDIDEDNLVPVYEHRGATLGAADGSTSGGEYFDDMDGFTFGHPTAVRIPDGSLLIAHYAGRRGYTELRIARLTARRAAPCHGRQP